MRRSRRNSDYLMMPDATPLNIFSVVLALNLWTILRFWQDKAYAAKKQRRIPENSLLLLALIGGTPGAFLARHLFRHKTRKQPFSIYLWLILAIQIGIIIGVIL